MHSWRSLESEMYMWFLCQRSPSASGVQSELGGFDVGVKLLDVYDGDGSEDRDIKRGCLKG